MRIVELKIHTNERDNGSDKCDGSSRHGKLNSSFRFMMSF